MPHARWLIRFGSGGSESPFDPGSFEDNLMHGHCAKWVLHTYPRKQLDTGNKTVMLVGKSLVKRSNTIFSLLPSNHRRPECLLESVRIIDLTRPSRECLRKRSCFFVGFGTRLAKPESTVNFSRKVGKVGGKCWSNRVRNVLPHPESPVIKILEGDRKNIPPSPKTQERLLVSWN